jgi:hypothetical protein
MIHALAIVDQGHKCVTVTAGNIHHGTWAPGATTRNALEKIATDGWQPVAGARWTVSPADNGHIIPVYKEA